MIGGGLEGSALTGRALSHQHGPTPHVAALCEECFSCLIIHATIDISYIVFLSTLKHFCFKFSTKNLKFVIHSLLVCFAVFFTRHRYHNTARFWPQFKYNVFLFKWFSKFWLLHTTPQKIRVKLSFGLKRVFYFLDKSRRRHRAS